MIINIKNSRKSTGKLKKEVLSKMAGYMVNIQMGYEKLNNRLQEERWGTGRSMGFSHMCNVYIYIYLINLFLAALGLHCCAWAFSSCGEQGLLFVVVRGLLIAVASLVAEHGL